MLKWLAWRLFDLATLGFAALGFYYVPLGERTGYEHVQAIATSPEVHELAVGVVDAVRSLRDQMRHRLIEAITSEQSSADG